MKSLQVNTNYSRMMAEMETNEHAFDINAPGEIHCPFITLG